MFTIRLNAKDLQSVSELAGTLKLHPMKKHLTLLYSMSRLKKIPLQENIQVDGKQYWR